MQEGARPTGIIYCRVSSAEQVSGTSLEMQERLCREYAAREGIEIVGVYIEQGESAKTVNRTELQKALGFIASKNPRVDFFIVHKIERFARNADDHVMTQAFLRRHGTKLRSVTEQIDETPVGKLMEGMLANFAEFDNNVRAARSKSGMMERVKQGVWIWPAPLGYKRITKGGNIVLDDDTAPYVRTAFEEWAKGVHTYRSLAVFLSERGFRTRQGKKPCAQLMEKMLRNPVYYGVIRPTTWDFEQRGTFPPLIDEELFMRCQPAVRKRAQPGSRVKENDDFTLRQFVICPDCLRPLTASYSRGRHGGRYPYYHHQVKGCAASAYIPKETFEQNFVEFLQKVSPKARNEKLFKAVVMDVWQTNYKKLDADNARLRKEIESLEVERQRIFDFHRAGKYDDREFMEQKDMVNTTIAQRKLLLDEKRIEEFDMEEALAYCFKFVRESAKTWRDLEDLPAYRRRFQNQAFPAKTIFDGKEFRTPKMSLVYELNQSKTANKSNLVRSLYFGWNTFKNEIIRWNEAAPIISPLFAGRLSAV